MKKGHVDRICALVGEKRPGEGEIRREEREVWPNGTGRKR